MGNEASTADTEQHFSPEEREDQNQNLLGLLSLEHETLNTVEKEQRIIPLETPGKNDAEGVNEPDGKEELLEKKGEESDKNGVSKELIFLESNSDSGTITDVGAGDVRASETQKVTTLNRNEKEGELITLRAPAKNIEHDDSRCDDDHSNDDLSPSNPKIGSNKKIPPVKKFNNNQSQTFSEGSLRGTLEKFNENNICKDPILDAVAAGSAARKAKLKRSERTRRQQYFHRGRISQRGTESLFSNNNEWKVSLRRLAQTAASTAKTVAHVTAPVITDARQVVMSSATEFAKDVKIEWEKEHERPPENEILLSSIFDNEELCLSNKTFCFDTFDESDTLNISAKNSDATSPGKGPTYEFTDTGDWIDGTKSIPSKLTFDEKKEIEKVDKIDGIDNDNDSHKSKGCLFEELDNMEREFNTQIRSVLSSQSDHKLKILFDEDSTEHEFSERSTVTTFGEKTDSNMPFTTAQSASNENSSKIGLNSHDQELLGKNKSETKNLIQIENEHAIDLSKPEITTKSGRVVKPVRRLVDGCEISIGGENQYGSKNSQQSRDDKVYAPVEEENSQNPLSNKEDSTPLHLVHQSRTIIDPTIRENKLGENISLSDGNQNTEIRNALEETTHSSSDGLAIAEGDNELKGTTSASLHVFPATQTINTLNSTSDRSLDATPDVLVDNATKEAITTSLDTLPDIPVTNTQKVATNDLIHLIPPTQIDNALKGRSCRLSDATASDQIGNAGKESRETSSDAIPSTKINNTMDDTKELVTLSTAKIDDLRERKFRPLDVEYTKAQSLLGCNDDSIYQSEDIDTSNKGVGTYSAPQLNNSATESQLDQKISVQSFEDNIIFKDRKKIVKYVVTKLTGFDIEVKDKISNFDVLNSTSVHDYHMADSVFKTQIYDNIPSLSSNSLSSPPDIEDCEQKDESGSPNLQEKEINEFLPMFDFIPVRNEISREMNTIEDGVKKKSNSSEENIRSRKLFKQGSVSSTNDSLGSFSTHQKSSNSLSFSSSRRSTRRLRRQGSRLSLTLSNTQSARSPYETPVENRSIVDGKQPIDLNLNEHGGQLVRWDTDKEAKFPSVPDTEEMTEALERSELFHETLAAFSSLENTEFLKDFSLRGTSTVPNTLASLVWRQLIANWKHSEICKAMLTRASSIRSSDLLRHVDLFDVEDDISSLSTIQYRFDSRNVVLPNCFLSTEAYSSLRCDNDGNHDDIVRNGILVLTKFLGDIGPEPSSLIGSKTLNTDSPLRHNLSTLTEGDENSDALSITEIQREAKALFKSFQSIINCIVKYSIQNCSTCTDFECNDIASSCGVKDYASIRNKAKRKYEGDVSQVKDVLRGQITFPDEGSLICGLTSLHNIAHRGCNTTQARLTESYHPFKIVRLKNLFRRTGINDEIFTNLPTGYRHILVNIEFECGLIAELQFQLAQVFQVMGNEGYSLHQEIVSSEIEKILQHPSQMKTSKNNKEVVLGISSDDFVKSILTTTNDLNVSSQPEINASDENTTDSIPRQSDVTVTTSSDEKTITESPTGGGIGALAAQAALQRSGKTAEEDGERTRPPMGGGIGALAAQAALQRSGKTAEEDGERTRPPMGGGIGALAAQAALQRSGKTAEEDGERTRPPMGGGIGALAAQAALQRSGKTAEEEGERTRPPMGGGIGALAAQAALQRSGKTAEEEGERTRPPMGGGIGALAAQAALERSEKTGGIGALAAALKRSEETEDDEGERSRPPTRGGISALAAQAALQRSEKTGGIGALAAALKRSEETEDDEGEKSRPPMGGGIGALAAQAALQRSGKTVEEEGEKSRPPTGGGIGALAAQAALKRSKKTVDEDGERTRPPMGGGIGALAAQAALKRSKKTLDDEGERSRLPIGGGTGALAAQAAPKKPENEMASSILDNRICLGTRRHSTTTFAAAVMEAGVLDAISYPRDLSVVCCLHLLSSYIQKHLSRPPSSQGDEMIPYFEISSLSNKLLLRSLSISNQAASIGMIGWLEYGSRNLIHRSLNLPLEVLQRLSCNIAAEKDWALASDVLCSLLLRCEENLPQCHPTTICSMLDLAGALSEAQNTDFAKSITSQALDLITAFLSEAESLFFDRRYFELYCNDPNNRRVVFFDDCVDAIGIMEAFSKEFRGALSRDFLNYLGRQHPIVLLNHALVADCFLVLANCLSASEEKNDTSMPVNCESNQRRSNGEFSSFYFWSLAHSHYDVALRGWISVESLIHPNAASTIFSIARCLRELGKLKEAVKLLETLASCLEQKLDYEILSTKTKPHTQKKTTVQQVERPLSTKNTSLPMLKDDEKVSSISTPIDSRLSFIPQHRHVFTSPSLNSGPENDQMENCAREQTAALCLWMMAVLTAEQSPDESGRSRALSLLHTASLTLQRALSRMKSTNGSSKIDDQTRLICLDLYEQIEGEALDLFEPLKRIPLVMDFEANHKESNATNPLPRKKRAPWEILTPMRQKRQWTSPRSRMNGNRAVSDSNSFTTAMSSTTSQAREISKNAFIQRL